MMQSNPAVDNLPDEIEMPRYQCHKIVQALKIDRIGGSDLDEANRQWLVPVDTRFAAFSVSQEYMKRHRPEAGGYFVVYKDGHKSYSPAKAFEEGYNLTENPS